MTLSTKAEILRVIDGATALNHSGVFVRGQEQSSALSDATLITTGLDILEGTALITPTSDPLTAFVRAAVIAFVEETRASLDIGIIVRGKPQPRPIGRPLLRGLVPDDAGIISITIAAGTLSDLANGYPSALSAALKAEELVLNKLIGSSYVRGVPIHRCATLDEIAVLMFPIFRDAVAAYP